MQFKVLFILFFVETQSAFTQLARKRQTVRYCVNGAPLEAASTNMARYFDPRIIGGSDAPEGQFPYVAAILIGDDFVMVACGGSILLPNLLLTAAHCIDVYEVPGGGLMRTFHAVVGSNNFRSGGITVQFGGYHIHPDWNRCTMKNDLGILRLTEFLELSKAIQLVSLGFDFMHEEEPSFVVGWGLIATRPAVTPLYLQILEVNTLTPQVCADVISEASAAIWPDAPTVDPELEICSFYAGGLQQLFTPGLCYGDSGSPLMSNKTGVQIGITSWAFPCATGVPDVHTRLSPYAGWIKYHMGL